MQTIMIPDGLELVTDPDIIKLFPSSCNNQEQQTFSFMPEKKKLMSLYDKETEDLGKILRYKRTIGFSVFDENGNVNPQPRCAWSDRKLARFISRYVHFYQKPASDTRTFILEQIGLEAKENNVILPKPSEMQHRKPKRRLACEVIDHSVAGGIAEYRAYYDGENIVAYMRGENTAAERERYERTKWDDLFIQEYTMLKSYAEFDEKGKDKAERNALRSNLEMTLIERFYKVYGYSDSTEKETCSEFIHRKIYNMSAAYAERKKRFHRKKDQIRWTYWVTITYDDKKFLNEQAFKKTLLTRFRNLCDPKRQDWLIMGVFEHGELNGRLHFHGFCYVPDGKAVGQLVPRSKYSEKEKCWHNYKVNTDFEEKFGDNEFEDIREAMQQDVKAMSTYTAKMLGYMEKGGTVYYSRHIPTDFLVELDKTDMLIAYSITCKRSIKRYVVSDLAVKRTNTTIERATRLPEPDPYDTGLLDYDAA